MKKPATCRVCDKPHESYWARKTICPDCDLRASGIKLSPGQQLQMAKLATRNAFSRDRAHWGPGTSPVTVGYLVRKGLADKRVVSRNRSQRTHYWLTPLGREVSRRRGAAL